MAQVSDEFRIQYAWLPEEALQVFYDAWIEDETTAWEMVRRDSRYETWFPGNKTDDGRVRITESQYAKTIVEYQEAFQAVGIHPDFFKERFADLIRGEVTPDELYQERLAPMYDRIVASSLSIRTYFAEHYGIEEMTPEAFMAGVLDPNLGTKILLGQIGVAEIGGEALESGFDITDAFARQLMEAGVNQQTADQLFSRAQVLLPTLEVLAQRHNDADDDFDINEFTAAAVFSDPTQLRRIRRLQAQESALFANVTGEIQYSRQRDSAGVSGLEAY